MRHSLDDLRFIINGVAEGEYLAVIDMTISFRLGDG